VASPPGLRSSVSKVAGTVGHPTSVPSWAGPPSSPHAFDAVNVGQVTKSSEQDFLRPNAPSDVHDTVAWLSDNGYRLASQEGASTFGADFVFEGESIVRIVVDRSQWMLDVARSPGADAWQYDLLIAAHSGEDYGQRFPDTGSRAVGRTLPEQLPEGVSWRDTLPDVVRWLRENDVTEQVSKAKRQRATLMWGRSS
jgi:hypothetical protein